GDTLTYEIVVQPNVTPEDLAYTITDTIPAGLTYVAGSATATSGTVDVTGNTLTWTGVMAVPEIEYVVSNSADDPSCSSAFGGYLNLEAFGILAQSGITGDTVAYTAFGTGDLFNYYGEEYAGMGFTDDGFAIFDPASNYGGAPWTAQAIPHADLPNNVLPAFWHDFEIFYDGPLNHGVSLATSGAPGGVAIIEYDDIQLYGGSASIMDFEIVVSRAVDNAPGAYEIVYAFDNVDSVPGPATIGVENADGTAATALVNNGDASAYVSDGFMVCFDQVGAADPVSISYQVTVDASAHGILTNDVVHNTDNPGSLPASTSADVEILNIAPDCSGAYPSLDMLWSPNHMFVPIEVFGVTDANGDPITLNIDSIFQDEPVNDKGSGSTSPDGQGIDTSVAEVRAERSGRGNGRFYHIGFMASDDYGGSCSAEVLVAVPKSYGIVGPVDDGALYDSTIP
ncbi:MAG: hypothetical protein ACK2T3_09160, partial [Candidatus Promineifilaceae bacterium]